MHGMCMQWVCNKAHTPCVWRYVFGKPGVQTRTAAAAMAQQRVRSRVGRLRGT